MKSAALGSSLRSSSLPLLAMCLMVQSCCCVGLQFFASDVKVNLIECSSKQAGIGTVWGINVFDPDGKHIATAGHSGTNVTNKPPGFIGAVSSEHKHEVRLQFLLLECHNANFICQYFGHDHKNVNRSATKTILNMTSFTCCQGDRCEAKDQTTFCNVDSCDVNEKIDFEGNATFNIERRADGEHSEPRKFDIAASRFGNRTLDHVFIVCERAEQAYVRLVGYVIANNSEVQYQCRYKSSNKTIRISLPSDSSCPTKAPYTLQAEEKQNHLSTTLVAILVVVIVVLLVIIFYLCVYIRCGRSSRLFMCFRQRKHRDEATQRFNFPDAFEASNDRKEDVENETLFTTP